VSIPSPCDVSNYNQIPPVELKSVFGSIYYLNKRHFHTDHVIVKSLVSNELRLNMK